MQLCVVHWMDCGTAAKLGTWPAGILGLLSLGCLKDFSCHSIVVVVMVLFA